ncbi:MAG: ATP-binding protein [Myxococcaceae bacterium]
MSFDVASVADDLPVGIWVARSPDGAVVYVNAAFAEIIGVPPESHASPETLSDLYHVHRPDGRIYPPDELPYARAVKEGRVIHADDLVIHRPDGRRVWLRVMAKPVFDKRGKLRHVLVVFADITEREQMRARMASLDRMSAVGSLASGVAHEMNTPLTSVANHLDILERALGDEASLSAASREPLRGHLVAARESVSRVSHIMRDLSTFARQPRDERVPLRVEAAVKEALRCLSENERRDVEWVEKWGHTPWVEAEPKRLAQVFEVLLRHAFLALPETGEGPRAIEVATHASISGNACVDISDSGAALSLEHRARLFDPFFVVRGSVSGMGLGLPVARNVVQGLGGTLDVVTSVMGRTTLRVTLPATEKRPRRQTPKPSRLATDRRPSVLILDDDYNLMRVLAAALADACEVDVFKDSAAAMKAVLGEKLYDIILCDVMMQPASGIQVYETLRAEFPGRERRLVFMTGGAFTEEAKAFLGAVPNLRFIKPFIATDVVNEALDVLGLAD